MCLRGAPCQETPGGLGGRTRRTGSIRCITARICCASFHLPETHLCPVFLSRRNRGISSVNSPRNGTLQFVRAARQFTSSECASVGPVSILQPRTDERGENNAMGEIAQLLQQRVGLNQDQAQSAETEVIAFVKSRVPGEFQGVLDMVLGGGQAPGGDQAAAPAAPGGLGSLLGAAEGLLGGRDN